MKLRRSTLAVALVGASAMVLSGCHPARLGQGKNREDKPVSVGVRLDCPQSEGELTRVDIASDGRSCRYTGPEGREARLMFLDLGGKSARDALGGTEAELKALLPAAVAPPTPPASPTPPAPPAAPGAAASDDDDKDDGSHDHTRIDLPGIHIEADGNKGAKIRAFGQTIDAHDKNAVIHGGWNGKEAVINAHDGGAEIRAGWFGEKSVDTNYILASDQAGPTGVHAAGYVAKGPATGPLVVGVETSKIDGDSHNRDEQFRDLKRLVNRNVHRG